MNFFMFIPSRTSYIPGLLTCPAMHSMRVPPFFGVPRLAYASPPSRIIDGTALSVSTLLMIVGHPYNPTTAGKRGFIRIANHVLGLRRVLGHDRPLHSRRESCAAATAQVRLLHFLDDRLRRHLFQRFLQRFVAALHQVDVDLVRVFHPPSPADERRFQLVPFV